MDTDSLLFSFPKQSDPLRKLICHQTLPPLPRNSRTHLVHKQLIGNVYNPQMWMQFEIQIPILYNEPPP